MKTIADQRGRQMRFRWWANDCGARTDGTIAPGTQVRMWPIGTNHRVRYLKAHIMWQQWNPTFGRWNTTLQRTYRSADHAATWLSPFHRFGRFTGEGRLVVKFTGVRDNLIDLNHTQVVAWCGTTPTGA